jgi:glycosyltransferase involved in cell wall biosynthesis
MHIAYLINQYPKVSHTFIRREILALERGGVAVTRIALRGWQEELVDAEDVRERNRTRYVLRDGATVLILALARMALLRPLRVLRAAALAWRMSRSSARPLLIHLAYVAEACRIEPWLRVGGVSHLHAHFGTNSAEVAMLVRTLGGPPWSFTVHGPEEFDKAQSLGLDEKVRRCTFVVAVSSYGRSQLYRSLETEYWPKVQVVHCGLEPAVFGRPKALVPAAPRLVCVGRLCEQKGQILLIEAARWLAEQGMEVELVLAGDGEMRAEIEALVLRHNLQRQVRITGWISSEQVYEHIVGARALVLPSFAEGLPVVIVEAMALRRPVISTFVAGIPELVKPGENGWLVPAGDLESLIQAMRDCLGASPQSLTDMGEAAHERAVARHNIDIEAARLVRLFETVSVA